MQRISALSLLMVLVATGAIADEPCAGFKWDVRKEQSLFAGPSLPLTAGRDAASAPAIRVDRLYEVHLPAQNEVTFTVAPGKKTAPDGAFAGLATLTLEGPGSYRVALDLPFWVDIVANGKLATAVDFQGQRGCDAPHKIVEFDLRGSQPFVLQMSAADKAVVHVSVTRVAAAH